MRGWFFRVVVKRITTKNGKITAKSCVNEIIFAVDNFHNYGKTENI
jgi:hypothetical protein